MTKTDTRQKMIVAAAAMFQEKGYKATTWRALVDAADVPWGSVKHHFPGGKAELCICAINYSADLVSNMLSHYLNKADTAAEGVQQWFAKVATLLKISEYSSGCPLATLALETSAESEEFLSANAKSFARWRSLIANRLKKDQIPTAMANSLSSVIISAFEGAILQSKLQRSTKPMLVASDFMVTLISHSHKTSVA